jgi:hypothetical protein
VRDGGQSGFVDPVEIAMQPGRALREPGDVRAPHGGRTTLANARCGDRVDGGIEARVPTPTSGSLAELWWRSNIVAVGGIGIGRRRSWSSGRDGPWPPWPVKNARSMSAASPVGELSASASRRSACASTNRRAGASAVNGPEHARQERALAAETIGRSPASRAPTR